MKNIFIILMCVLLSACGGPMNVVRKDPEILQNQTTVKTDRVKLPDPAKGKIVVAVYNFGDKTGQRKDSNTIAKFSTAVTQGGETMLIKSLEDAGDGKWFRIVERVGLDNLLKERQLIRSAREEAKDPHSIGQILYAGMIIEGGIVSYDTNIRTGGIGVRWLGIGPDTQYQEDVVTVSIRAISVQTGEVLLTVNTQKTLLSYTAGVAIFKFYDNGTKNFESEIGITQTEASIHCIKSATDLAVEQLIIQGEKKGMWQFKEKSNEK
jgi:curli production assembly/transport component CsgG